MEREAASASRDAARLDLAFRAAQAFVQGSMAAVRERRLGPNLVALGELRREETGTEADSLYQKNLLPVTYVTGDLAGAAESPVYAILRMNDIISNLALPERYAFEIYNTRQPFDTTKYAMKWDGEVLFDPIFQGLAISLMAGAVALLLLSRVTGHGAGPVFHEPPGAACRRFLRCPSPAGALS